MKPFQSVRGRLSLLVVIAIMPALLLVGFATWTAQRLEIRAAAEQVGRLAALLTTQHDRLVGSTAALLRAMAETEELVGADPARCAAYLRRVVAAQQLYAGFARLGRDGSPPCS